MATTNDPDYKKYADSAVKGIRGEAFYESLVVGHTIPHRIARQNDLGADFLCEWVCGDKPTGLLFLAQVKMTTTDQVTPKRTGQGLNLLERYTLTGIEKIDPETLAYWKGLGFPPFLFVVIENKSTKLLECYYKRYTPLLDGQSSEDDQTGSRAFYHVNDGNTFRAFADPDQRLWGFARDLIIDYARLSYSRGYIVRLRPSELGFWPFPTRAHPDHLHVFDELVGWHRKQIEETTDWTLELLRRLPPVGR